ncbi:MAG: cellulase family glycosylhydrolase [Spirochaetes bacterium]|nr:cellulase family glycosylhydrolase [Spirochaetota bacterium]
MRHFIAAMLCMSAVLAGGTWIDQERQHRLIITVPQTNLERPDALVAVPFPALASVIQGAVAPASISVFETDTDGHMKTALRAIMESGYIYWQSSIPSGSSKTYHVYYALTRHPYTGASWEGGTPPDTIASAPDYAKSVYGHSWDFDDGGFAGITAWGNGPESILNKSVTDGILSFDAVGDPWITWGEMFGTGPKESIDSTRYTTLLMRVRQSITAASWQLFCLSDTTGIQKYEFPVKGSQWQTIRIHLAKDANFKGMLRSFRIDPTDKLTKPAHIDIDWVRLVPIVDGIPVAAETKYNTAEASQLTITVPEQSTAGETQTIGISITDAQRKPVSYADIAVTIRQADGKKAARYSVLAQKDGIASLLITNTAAGVFFVTAALSLNPAVAAEKKMTIVPGAASGVRISMNGHGTWFPSGKKWVVCVRDEDAFRIHARIVDRFGNTVSQDGGTVWNNTENVGKISGGSEFKKGLVSASVQALHSGELTASYGALTSEPVFVHVSPKVKQKNGISILKNGYFGFADGRVFLPLGGHYANWPLKPPDFKGKTDLFPCNPIPFTAAVPFDSATRENLTAWFSQLSNCGVNTLRLMLRNMDLIGKVDEVQLAAVKEYMELARGFGIYFIVVVLEDYKKPPYVNRDIIDKIVLPRFPDVSFDNYPAHRKRFFVDKDIVLFRYVDADARRCKREYLAELIPHLMDIPNILTYELENEMVGAPASWINEMTALIKAVDPKTPVSASTGGGGLLSGDPYFFTSGTSVDFYTYHQYPTLSEKPRSDALAAGLADDDLELGNWINTLTRYGRACNKPAILGESGWFDNFFKSGETPQYLLRDIVWLALVNDPGHCFWLFGGTEASVYRPVANIMARLDLPTFMRSASDACVDATHSIGGDYYYFQSNRADYYALLAHNRRALDAGAQFDFDLGGKSGCTPLRDKNLPAGKQYAAVGKGYQAALLAGNNYERILIYARNYAGTEKLMRNDTTKGFGIARTRAASELSLSFNLPHASYTRWVYDLDGDMREETVAGNTALTLPASDHDYIIVLRKSGN